MRELGAPAAAIEKAQARAAEEAAAAQPIDEDFELWPENLPSWNAFLTVSTQWVFAGLSGQRMALDYGRCEMALRWGRRRNRRQQRIFEHIQLIEAAVLQADRELAPTKEE